MRLFDRIARDSHCTPADKAVAWALLWGFYNGDTGRCDPSTKVIGARTLVDHRHVKRAIKHLDELGHIRIGHLKGTAGKFGPTNTYEPVLDEPTAQGRPCHPVTPLPPDEGVAPMSPGDIQSRDPGAAMSPKPREEEPREEGALRDLVILNPSANSATGKEMSRDPGAAMSPGDTLAPGSNDKGSEKQKAGSQRKRRAAAPKTNNLGVFVAFEPTPHQLERLATKVPRVAAKLNLLVEQFKTDPWWRKKFEAGAYSDPASSFENFVIRQEGIAFDRGMPIPVTAASHSDKPRRPLVAGTPEARAAYD